MKDVSSEITRRVHKQIELAFADVPYPGDENISDSHADEGTRRDFAGKHWRELSRDFIRAQADNLSFFTPEAFVFYLPAYLIACLDLKPGDIVGEFLLDCLSPPTWGGANSSFDVIFHSLTDKQRESLVSFFQYQLVEKPGRLFDVVGPVPGEPLVLTLIPYYSTEEAIKSEAV